MTVHSAWMITNPKHGTNIHEVASGIYRINTPVDIPGGPRFNFNQYLIVDDEPLVFHTGPRKLFPLLREAIGRVMPSGGLRYIGMSHFEVDECGAMNEFLAVAPRSVPLCSRTDEETISLGKRASRSVPQRTRTRTHRQAH